MKIFSNKWCWLIIFLGTLVLSWPMTRLGGKDGRGNLEVYGYWDQLMHVAFTHELMRQFPPQNPLFAGELLYNYNFGSDAVAAVISKTSSLSPITVQFKVLPVIYSLFLGVSAWWLARILGMSSINQVFFLFLTYFGSSFSFAADLFLKKNISWDDAFGLNQPVSYAGNLPILLSLSLWLMLLALLFSWEKRSSLVRGVLISLIIAASPLAKAVSIPVITAAAVFSLGYFFISGKRPLFWKLLFAVTAGIFFMVLTMRFFGKNSGGLVWYPLNSLDRLIESPNFYDLTESWQLSWQTYRSERNLPVMVIWYLVAAGVFIIGNLGSRLIGLLGLLVYKKRRQWDWRRSILLVSLAVSVFLPMFFILGTGGFNISYMFYFAMVVINIPAAVGLSRLIKKKRGRLDLANNLFIINFAGNFGDVFVINKRKAGGDR